MIKEMSFGSSGIGGWGAGGGCTRALMSLKRCVTLDLAHLPGAGCALCHVTYHDNQQECPLGESLVHHAASLVLQQKDNTLSDINLNIFKNT